LSKPFASRVILHPLHHYPEGLAYIEKQAWSQMTALSFAWQKRYVWLGRELNDQEVLTQAYL
jgi:RNA:NAD 2'-phosphotransferase (TPT1/KptA family)